MYASRFNPSLIIQREQGIGTPEQEKLMFKNMRLK
jgi:hypothetical protein